MSSATRIAVILQFITGAYLQTVEWVDLAPWNDVASGNRQATFDIVLLVVQAAVLLVFLRRWLWGMIAGWSFYFVWLWLQVSGWWKPYLVGGRHVGAEWFFARTYKFLPPLGDRPVPDANHVVLQLLIVAVLAASGVAIISRVRSWPTGAA